MKATFNIEVEPRSHLLKVKLDGFFSEIDVRRFADDFRAAVESLRAKSKGHLTLVDVRGLQIQSQDRIVEFQALLADPAYKAERLAFVVAHTLARLQVKRAADGRNAEFFENEEEALTWLHDTRSAAA